MAELIAKGSQPHQQCSWTLAPGDVTLGRSPDESTWAVPWDLKISRKHAVLSWQPGLLRVRRRPDSRNRVFYHNEPKDDFFVRAGEQFQIGDTLFIVEEEADLPAPMSEMTCTGEELRRFRYADAEERIEVLSALPEMIRGSLSLEQMERRVVEVLLRGIPRAVAAAIVHLPADSPDTARVGVRAIEQRPPFGLTFQPSRRLVMDALHRKRQGVMHIWSGAELADPMYTNAAGLDWALCTPIPDPTTPGLALYVAGKLMGLGFRPPRPGDSGRNDLLTGDLKFAQVAADIFGALRQVTALQKREGLLSRFFSQTVRAALVGRDLDEVLQPRETTVTVLFCDLRGSCRMHEGAAHELFPLWRRVSDALGIMSGAICAEDGVINDFQGDAAMGFWNWPLPQADQIERAARAALTIRRRFAEVSSDRSHPLHGFAYGMGIAHGMALAGRLGTTDQFKVDVFGPTVNLAARLEGMTKQFGVPVLMDEACAQVLSQSNGQGPGRVRRLARVQPYGMSRVLMVSELLQPEGEPGAMSPEHHRGYDQALELFQAGRWQEAQAVLARLPEEGGRRFLLACMQGKPAPPPGWTGSVALSVK